MPDFRRMRGETHAAWLARLRAVRPDGLSRDQLNDLTARRIEAAALIRCAARTHARKQSRGSALRRCIEAARGLSSDDTRRLMAWLRDLPDG